MKRFKLWICVFLVFLAGFGLGAGATVLVARFKILQFIDQGPRGVREAILRQLTRKLDLDGDQQKKIATLVAETHDEILIIRRRVQPQVNEILERGVGRIKAQLRPDQQGLLDKMYQNLRTRMRRFDEVNPGSEAKDKATPAERSPES